MKIVKDMQEYDYSLDVPLLNTIHKPIGQKKNSHGSRAIGETKTPTNMMGPF